MSSGRRTAFAGAALVLATGAVAVMVWSLEPRPVDVRRVDLSPARPEVLSATYTTTVAAQRSSTAVEVIAPPAQRPLPPVQVVTTTSTRAPSPPPPPPSPPPRPPAPPRDRPPDCGRPFSPDRACAPDPFPDPHHLRRYCDWLRDRGLLGTATAGHHHARFCTPRR
ncbi:hypothetical protein [Saccharothrix xinjiangensis]|uniref:Uncharacterized protein n=1 Tax=Saccharothrix xinjiangensis TaxID=204798 RepID=A0ABV9Y8V8_9PSEU